MRCRGLTSALRRSMLSWKFSTRISSLGPKHMEFERLVAEYCGLQARWR